MICVWRNQCKASRCILFSLSGEIHGHVSFVNKIYLPRFVIMLYGERGVPRIIEKKFVQKQIEPYIEYLKLKEEVIREEIHKNKTSSFH